MVTLLNGLMIYDLKLRTEGGMSPRYAERFPKMHKGMLWLQDVPGFEWVYIHTGNRAEHTEGCLLVGDSALNNQIREGFVGQSENAYRRIYPAIADAVASEGATVEIRAFG